MPIATVNPATGETLKTFEPISNVELERTLERAQRAFRAWRLTPFTQRAEGLSRLASLLEAEATELGRLMTVEMGKPLRQGIDEAKKCAAGCRYYAENGERFLSGTTFSVDRDQGRVEFQPLGPVLAVMPWNFPFWQVIRFAAPAVMAGNVGLLKHASNVPQCAQALESLFLRAGFPEGVFQNLLLESKRVAPVIADARIKAVTLTGSEAAGRQIAGQAGEALKKTVLELGGSDPFIVTAKSDVEAAARAAVKGRLVNNGQSCIAAKRFIVVEAVADTFQRLFVEGMEKVRVGDPLDEATELGPLATAAIRDELHGQVQDTVKAGARILTGGLPLPGPGFYYAPTVLTEIPRESPGYRDELFGPVAGLFRVKDVDAAVALANDSGFGLGCSVWTRDRDEQERFIRDIESGAVFINAITASDPRLP
ncbi:MAG TPA: NAD-dependent succinate-semialdehyde dehydrogenase, partial [Myxococcaceae bacterium]|nr:NAD-dependent succinate-semialdehyde dehydrogenase [Myxococcaceae bacterium]